MNPKWGGQGLITECDFWKGGNRVNYFRRVLELIMLGFTSK